MKYLGQKPSYSINCSSICILNSSSFLSTILYFKSLINPLKILPQHID